MTRAEAGGQGTRVGSAGAFLLALLFCAGGCERQETEQETTPAKVTEQGPAQSPSSDTSSASQSSLGPTLGDLEGDMTLPAGYEGPIDPQWPPSHAADLDVELKASRILRRILKRGQRPPKTPLLAGDVSGVYADQGRIGGFDYIEVVLGPMAHPDEKMPLIILLHGRGGRPTIPEGPYLTTRPLRLFIPRGPDSLKGGYNWLATWTNSGRYELLSRSLAGRVDQLMPAIEAYGRLRPTEGKPIVIGFSQGGILSYALATRYPDQFAAAFPIAGWLPPGMVPTEKKSGVNYPFIHAFHGAADTVVPTEKDRETVTVLKELGIDVIYSEFAGVGHEVTTEINRDVRQDLLAFLHVE